MKSFGYSCSLRTFSYTSGTLNPDSLTWAGTNSRGRPKQSGIYTETGGAIAKIADRTTLVPGGAGTFLALEIPVADGNIIAFEGTSSDGLGIYASIDGILDVVADPNTAVPNGSGKFRGATNASADGGHVAFFGSHADTLVGGIYTTHGGGLTEVIKTDEALDGKTVAALKPFLQSLSGNWVVFRAEFFDGSEGIYLATGVPEPVSFVICLSSFGICSLLVRQSLRKTS